MARSSGDILRIGNWIFTKPSEIYFEYFCTWLLTPSRSAGQSFILKHVSEHFIFTSQQIADDFPSTKRLRVHTDVSRKESVLVYPYFRDTLLALMKNDPEFPPLQRLKIMRAVAEAVAELHAKDWIHSGMLY